MPTQKEILADRERYPDDLKINIAEGVETTLGDLRSYAAQENQATITSLQEQQRQLSELETRLTQQAEAVAQYEARLQEQSGRSAGGDDLVTQLIERLRGPGKKTVMDLTDDEFFGPAVKEIRAVSDARKAINDEIERLRGDAGKIVTFFTRRELERDWNSLPDRPKELKIQQVIDHAMKHGYGTLVDPGDPKSFYPDMSRAYDEIMQPVRSKAQRERDRKEIRTEIEKEQAEERAKRPVTRQDAIEQRGHVFVPNGAPKGTAPPPRKQGGFGGPDKVPTEVILQDPDIAGIFNQ